MTVKTFIKFLIPNFLLNLYYDYKNKKKAYFGHHAVDKKLRNYLDYKNGFFIELGANDGIKQSNTYYFEKNLNWNGVLIEPIKKKYLSCIKNRSKKNHFFNYACVSFDYKNKKIKMFYSDLMSIIKDEKIIKEIDTKEHALKGKKYLLPGDKIEEFWVDTITLNEILIKSNAPKIIDFLSLDVEGSEIEVLKGINFSEFNFKFIMIESRNDQLIKNFFEIKNYFFIEKISERDLLFKYKYF
tara:strand:- start:1288 stop:2010 length:723 start_codon:yes stop_codon:yes gene_type:complete